MECGGCNGADTELMAKTWPNGTIYTFEPVPAVFDLLKKRVAPYRNVHAYELALADITGKMTFYLSNLNINLGASSLLPPQEVLKFDGTTFDVTFEVDAMRLDDWGQLAKVDRLDFMWLDMQGYELNMLQVSELAKTAKVIYTEVEFIEAYKGQYLYADVKNWMMENGFELVALDFEEGLALGDTSIITPGGPNPYAGNAVFLTRPAN